MSTSSVRMCMGWHRPYGGVPFLISPTSPLETKEHVPQISEEESGVQTVLQKQIVKPLYWCHSKYVVKMTTITRENVTTLFPDVHTRLIGADMAPTATPEATSSDSNSNPNSSDDLAGYDEEQIRLMDEVCIVLDENDMPIGSASKKACHLMTNINQGLLHRAFSAFVFDPSTKKLLLQQRASEKITFPDMWTNTCCSHPLAHPSETGHGDLVSNVEGAKRAAIRKLNHELGIQPSQVPIEKFDFLTRIHYLAPSDGKWGEHEIDYILFIEADVTLDINKNEVQDTRWVSPEELRQMFKDVESRSGKDQALKYTPWFRLICEGMLFDWWEKMAEDKLSEVANETQIRRMLEAATEKK
ncbi:isopentenyl-diphosphate delta-isomerase idi1 [Exophiala xenobiotica]